MKQIKRVVITGGGTGGHIYPGLAIAQEIQRLHPGVDVHFVGATGGLEEKIFPRSGFPHHFLKVGRLHASVGRWQQIKTLLGMPFTLLQALFLFLRLRPQVILGVGGFASGPFLFLGHLFGARTAIWEPNAYPGLTNRWLARWVDISFVVFKEAQQYLASPRVVEVGLPVRQEFFENYNLPPRGQRLRVLVFGGSQGARAINEVVVKCLREHPELVEKMQWRHQTGNRDYHRLLGTYGTLVQQVQVSEYIHDMPRELQMADLVICRSGASTVAEVIACRKPAVFVPLPTAADNHQFKNAEVLAQKKAAVLLEQKDLNSKKLAETLLRFCENPQLLDEMSGRLEEFDFSKASQNIVKTLFQNED